MPRRIKQGLTRRAKDIISSALLLAKVVPEIIQYGGHPHMIHDEMVIKETNGVLEVQYKIKGIVTMKQVLAHVPDFQRGDVLNITGIKVIQDIKIE